MGEEEEEEEENEVVDVSDSNDIYEVLNQPPSLVTTTSDLDQFSQLQSNDIEGAVTSSDEMGIQRKQRLNLQELLESQLERDAPEKSAQTSSPLFHQSRPIKLTLPTTRESRRKKGKEVMEIGKNVPPKEVEP